MRLNSRRPRSLGIEDGQEPLQGRERQRTQSLGVGDEGDLTPEIEAEALALQQRQRRDARAQEDTVRLSQALAPDQVQHGTIMEAAQEIPEMTQEAMNYYDPDLKNPDVTRMRSAVNSFMMGLTQFVPNAMKTKALIEAKIHENLGWGGKIAAVASRLTPMPNQSWDTQGAEDLYEAGVQVGEWLEEAFPENPEYQEEFWAGMVARGAGQMTGQVLASLATGGVGGGAMAVFGVNSVLMSTLGTQYYEEAVQEGASDNQAFSYMLANMTGNSALNALPMVMMLRRLNNATGNSLIRTVKAGFIGSVEEGVTEGMQQWYSNMTAQQIFGSTRDMFDGVLEGMAVGAILGATANVTTNALIGERMKKMNSKRRLEIERTLAEIDRQVESGIMPDGQTPKQRVEQRDNQTSSELKSERNPKEAVVSTDETIAQNKPVKRVEDRTRWERWRSKMWDWFPFEERAGRIIDQGKAELAGELRRAELYVADLVESVYEAHGVNSPKFRSSSIGKLIDDGIVPADIGQKIDNALRDREALSQLPEAMQEPVNNMRKHMDFLTQEFSRRGYIKPEQVAEFQENLGVYIHRSYKVYDQNVKWDKNTIPQDLWNTTLSKMQAIVHNDIIADPKRMQKHLGATDYKMGMLKHYKGLPKKHQDIVTKQFAEIIMHKILDARGSNSIYRIGQMLNAPASQAQLRKEMMDKKEADTSMMQDMEADMSIFKERQDIPKFLREFMGENHDGSLNYVRSVEKMAGFLARRSMFDKLSDQYSGTLFLSEAEKFRTENPADYVKLDTGTKSRLDNKYMHREMYEQLMHDHIASGEGRWLEYWYKFNMATKFSKTVLSHVTVIRNVTGGMMFLGFNGHMPGPTAAKLAWNKARVAFMSPKRMSKSERKAHWQELALHYERLGLFGKSVRAGELERSAVEAGMEKRGVPNNFAATQNMFERVFDHNARQAYDQRGVTKLFGKFTKKAGDFYRAGDDFVRILFYELELARNNKHNIYSPETRAQDTANDVLNFYQNYDRVGAMWDAPRRFPFAAPFVSFPAEVSRTMINTGQRIHQDLNSGNKGRKAIGRQRLAGVVSTVVGLQAAAVASQMLHNISDEEDQAYREFMPPWDRNSIVVYTSAERGQVRYINTSYTNPYAYFMDPFVALTKGADDATVLELAWEGLKELFQPIIGEEIFTQAAREVLTNSKTGGGEVYNPQDVIGDKVQKMMLHMWSAFEPGSLTSAQRAVEPFTDDHSDRKGTDELMGLFGLRLITVDVKDSFGFSIRDHRQEIRDARRLYNSVKYNERSTNAEINEAYRRSNQQYEGIFNRMANLIDAAQSTGTRWRDLEQIMQDSGLAQRDINALRRGVFRPFDR